MERLDEGMSTVAEEAVRPLAVGDEVKYIPQDTFALQKDAAGEYPWAIGRRSRDGQSTEELTGRDLELFLAGMRRKAAALAKNAFAQARGTATSKALAAQIIRIRPNKTWRAVVTAVNDDGTVDLDIHGANTAVTLHCPRIKVDRSASIHHTCHP